MKNHLVNFAEGIFEKYKELDLPTKFTLKETGKILREKYKAYEEDINLADIDEESKIHAQKYYVIEDVVVLKELFTAEEKLDLYAMIEMEPHSFEYEIEKMWNDVQQGRRLNIILESEDGTYISGVTLQGMSENLFNELMIYQGIEANQCRLGNEDFHEYLKRLITAGYI